MAVQPLDDEFQDTWDLCQSLLIGGKRKLHISRKTGDKENPGTFLLRSWFSHQAFCFPPEDEHSNCTFWRPFFMPSSALTTSAPLPGGKGERAEAEAAEAAEGSRLQLKVHPAAVRKNRTNIFREDCAPWAWGLAENRRPRKSDEVMPLIELALQWNVLKIARHFFFQVHHYFFKGVLVELLQSVVVVYDIFASNGQRGCGVDELFRAPTAQIFSSLLSCWSDEKKNNFR